MFGFKLVRKSELEELEKRLKVLQEKVNFLDRNERFTKGYLEAKNATITELKKLVWLYNLSNEDLKKAVSMLQARIIRYKRDPQAMLEEVRQIFVEGEKSE